MEISNDASKFNETAPNDTGDSESDDTDWDGNESEQEDDFLALSPSQTDVFVFIANPARSTVTRVNVFTQEVRTTEVGLDPSIVTVTPDYATAAVFNNGSDSVSIVEAATLDVLEVDVRDNFNQMSMSPQGGWVGLFHDKNAEDLSDPDNGGIQSFNEVSFVSLPDGEHHAMAVGFNPREIQFTQDDTLAIVVSDEAVALVDLTADKLKPRIIDITLGADTPPPAEEVVINPIGSYAFVRQFGATDLIVIDLATEQIEQIDIGANPTDLDLSPDGSLAVVVSRASKQLHVIDAENPLDEVPQVVDLPADLSLGSVLFDPIGEQALVYTTASLTPYYAVWDLENNIAVQDLPKPIRAMSITPTGESLMVIHTQDDAVDADTNGYFYGHHAISLVDLNDFRQNTLKLPAEPSGYVNGTSGIHGYFIMDGVKLLAQVDYETLLYEQVDLKSNPVYVGVLPDLEPDNGDMPPAWVSQEHPLGRLTFYDPDDGSAETITGFELNSRIED
jgi:DNA-binding beta-propeller fold protein YncE